MRLLRALGPITLALLLSGCSALSVFDGPRRDHISVANRSGYNVSVAPDGRTLLVALDTQSAVEKKFVWAATLGTAAGPPSSEFDSAASDWLKMEKPDCKASNGHRTSLVSFEYDLTCQTAEPQK